jgi:hypothetical protein
MQTGPQTDDALSYGDDLKEVIIKRRLLADQFPDEEHIMVITSNKRAQQPGGKSHTAATLLRILPGGSDGGANEIHERASSRRLMTAWPGQWRRPLLTSSWGSRYTTPPLHRVIDITLLFLTQL